MRREALVYILVLILIGSLYRSVIEFEYVWDDVALFLDSAALRGGLGFWDAVMQPILPGTTYFRPLVLASVYVEFQFGGPSASFSHAVNLALFLLNCLLVALLVRSMHQGLSSRKQLYVSTAAMLFYGFHPAQIESVAWVSARFDLMATMFSLVALIAGMSTGRGRSLIVAVASLAGLLSKEMALVLPVLLVCLTMVRNQVGVIGAVSGVRGHLAAMAAAFVIYVVLRVQFVVGFYNVDRSQMDVMSLPLHAALIGQTYLFYIKTILVPFYDLGPIHPFNILKASTVQLVVGWLTLVLACCFCTISILGRRSNLLMGACVLLALIPVSNLIPLNIAGSIGAERFLSLPLVFGALIFGVMLLKLSDIKAGSSIKVFLSGLLGGWLALSALVTSVQLPFWRSSVSLWSWAYAKHADSEFVQFSLISSLVKAGSLEEAERVLSAVENNEGLSWRLRVLQASNYQRMGRYNEALESIDSALKNSAMPHEHLIKAGGNLAEASIARETFGDGWLYRFLHGVKAEIYLGLRRFEEAEEAAKIGQFYQRDYAPMYLLESLALYGQDKIEEANSVLRKAESLYDRDAKLDAEMIVEKFKHDICAFDDRPRRVCEPY